MTTSTLSQVFGSAGLIEITTLSPNFSSSVPSRALLVMHPHPLHGGCMNNKVVTTIARAGRDAGLTVVRFNFRGVGKSQGVWDGGIGELDDAVVVISALVELGVSDLLLAGFSFGACIAANVIPRISELHPALKVSDLILVAPAVENFPIQINPSENFPRMVCVNNDDDVVNPNRIIDYADKVNADIKVHPTGGHYFHGELVRLKQILLQRWTLLR